MMSKFRKKPVEIEAVEFRAFRSDGTAIFAETPEWLASAIVHGAVYETLGSHGATLKIATLEGDHTCTPGDMIIQGVKGELYPCKPDIFAATYEPVS